MTKLLTYKFTKFNFISLSCTFGFMDITSCYTQSSATKEILQFLEIIHVKCPKGIEVSSKEDLNVHVAMVHLVLKKNPIICPPVGYLVQGGL